MFYNEPMSVIWSPAATRLSTQELEMLQHPHSSGLILFAYNYESPRQVKELIDSALAVNPHIIVSVDQEGGRVQRFLQGMTQLPSAAKLGDLYAADKKQGLQAAYNVGRLCGIELGELGINVNYAPVLDVSHGISQVIGDRSYADKVAVVVAVAAAYTDGLQDAGVLAVGKHFPGHGGVAADSHETLPYDERSPLAIATDAEAFTRIFPKIKAVMTGHIVFPEIDDKAVTFSQHWLQKKLREEMSYQGVVISDDLSMMAAKDLYADATSATIAALNAGCDYVLLCNDVAGAAGVLDKLEESGRPVADGHIRKLLQAVSVPGDDSGDDSGNGFASGFDLEQARDLCRNLCQ